MKGEKKKGKSNCKKKKERENRAQRPFSRDIGPLERKGGKMLRGEGGGPIGGGKKGGGKPDPGVAHLLGEKKKKRLAVKTSENQEIGGPWEKKGSGVAIRGLPANSGRRRIKKKKGGKGKGGP